MPIDTSAVLHTIANNTTQTNMPSLSALLCVDDTAATVSEGCMVGMSDEHVPCARALGNAGAVQHRIASIAACS